MICSKNLSHLMLTEMAVLVISPRLGGVLRLPACSVAGLLADCLPQACWARAHQAMCV